MSLFHTVRHYALFARIALHVAGKYLPKLRPMAYAVFIRRAAILLWTFRHNRIVKTARGWKLQLYLPAYPSPAFFNALENKLLRTPPAPASVVFSMTRACSYKCPHCYQKTEQGADMDRELLLRTLGAVRDAGVSYFNIEGGEPFQRYERLLDMLAPLDSSSEVWVNTSGAGVTGERLEELKQHGVAGIMVSLHSPDPVAHDAFTGIEGSFAVACAAMRRAGALGISVAVNSVLAEQELRSNGLEALMDLTRNLGADYVQLIHPKPCGGWMEKHDAMQLDEALLDHIGAQHILYNSPQKAGYPSLAAQVFEERQEGVGCTAGGVDRFYITAAGEVQPCEFLQLSFGNVVEEPFADIFARMRAAYAVPRTAWLCCTQGPALAAFMRAHGVTATPLPWRYTQEFIAARRQDQGVITPLYKKLGIYKS